MSHHVNSVQPAGALAPVPLHRIPPEGLRSLVAPGVVAFDRHHPGRPGQIEVVLMPADDDPVLENRRRHATGGQHSGHPPGELAAGWGIAIPLEQDVPIRPDVAASHVVGEVAAPEVCPGHRLPA
jgi:hypothetical protein